MKKEKGLALIVVLWVITLLIIMASSFSLTIQRESVIISGIREKAEASAVAEAGIYYAIIKLFNSDKEEKWEAFDSLYEMEYAGKKVRINIADESGKIAINHIQKEPLLNLFNSVGLDEEEGEALSDAILDWRDSNDAHRIKGAEQQQYEDAGLSYKPRNAGFSNVEELQMVLGMNPEIYRKIEHMISIYTKAPQINPTTASREVLLTLPDVDNDMVNEYIEQRVENERNGEGISKPEWYQGNGSRSNIFMIISEAMIDKNMTQQIMAVIKRGRSPNGLPFEILKWSKESHLPSLFRLENDGQVVN
jgi:general secretion pathway protein K